MATGPTTPEGKQTVSRNAVTHGLTASKWLDATEQADYQALVRGLAAEHQPQTLTEVLMVERIAIGMTKLRRLQRVEDARYAQARDEARQPFMGRARPAHSVDAALPPMKLLDSLARYQTTLERQVSKTIGELMVLKRERAPAMPPPAADTKAG